MYATELILRKLCLGCKSSCCVTCTAKDLARLEEVVDTHVCEPSCCVAWTIKDLARLVYVVDAHGLTPSLPEPMHRPALSSPTNESSGHLSPAPTLEPASLEGDVEEHSRDELEASTSHTGANGGANPHTP